MKDWVILDDWQLDNSCVNMVLLHFYIESDVCVLEV
jgi:hypothetical protein